MNPISSDIDKKTLCDIVQALIEEWGRENLKFMLPKAWSNNLQTAEKYSEFYFVTEDRIVLSVELEGSCFRRELILDRACLNYVTKSFLVDV